MPMDLTKIPSFMEEPALTNETHYAYRVRMLNLEMEWLKARTIQVRQALADLTSYGRIKRGPQPVNRRLIVEALSNGPLPAMDVIAHVERSRRTHDLSTSIYNCLQVMKNDGTVTNRGTPGYWRLVDQIDSPVTPDTQTTIKSPLEKPIEPNV